MRRFKLFMALFLAVWLSTGSAEMLAQTAAGNILGTVKDQSGAVVAGVTVTIKSVATGTTRVLTTTDSGAFSAIALFPGDYVVSYEGQGFGKGQQTLTVAVGVTTNGDFAMPLASQVTNIDVADSPIAVNTAQAVVQDVLTTKQIDDLPLDGRNFFRSGAT